jgi:hypothetical protein
LLRVLPRAAGDDAFGDLLIAFLPQLLRRQRLPLLAAASAEFLAGSKRGAKRCGNAGFGFGIGCVPEVQYFAMCCRQD